MAAATTILCFGRAPVKSATNVIAIATVTRNNPVVSPDVGTMTTVELDVIYVYDVPLDVALGVALDVALDVVLDVVLDVEFDGTGVVTLIVMRTEYP